MTRRYVFVNHRECYIGLDSASGGYPFETESIFQANPFYTPEEAQRYYDTMSACVTDNDRYCGVLTWKLVEVLGIRTEESQREHESMKAEVEYLTEQINAYRGFTNVIDDYFEYRCRSEEDQTQVHDALDRLTEILKELAPTLDAEP